MLGRVVGWAGLDSVDLPRETARTLPGSTRGSSSQRAGDEGIGRVDAVLPRVYGQSGRISGDAEKRAIRLSKVVVRKDDP